MMGTWQAVVFLVTALAASAVQAADAFDLVLQDGCVVDGTGAPRYVADIGIREGKIAAIGRLRGQDARRTISAAGLIVAPGFVDMMGQTATPMLDDPESAMNLLTQGITTINAGEGGSAAPLGPEAARPARWQTMAEYFQILDMKGLPLNVAQTVGHTQVRRIVLGESDKQPSEVDMDRMKALVREAMEAGAVGLSTALIYPPAVYADTKEVAQLAAVAGEYGGRYYTHVRNEGDRLLEALDEAIEIGRLAKTPVHIFHLKAAGQDNWPKMREAIARILAAQAAGQQVTADIYPYVNNGLGIESLIHPRHFAQGRDQLVGRLDDPAVRRQIRHEMEGDEGWENWFRHVGHDWRKIVVGATSHERYARLSGKSLGEIAEALGEDPWDTFFALVQSGAFVLPETMSETNKALLIQQPFVSFCTDVGPVGSGLASHPRASGSFPRLLSHYVREQGVVSLERAVAQAAAVAANDVMAFDCGRIAVGLAADLVVLDYASLADRATFAEPNRLSEGVRYVLVNGELVLDDGKFTGKRPGRVLRGPGYRPDRDPAAVRTGHEDARTAPFDEMMVDFLRRHHVPGAALAVTDHGRLVHARGYGYADIASGEKVEPTSLFRIASISKPITAAAVLQLIEQGRLHWDDKVFDILQWEKRSDGGDRCDDRLRLVTIRHLLDHRGGWDRDASFDPMFQSVRFAQALNLPLPAGPEAAIRSMFAVRLDFAPGRRYAYSNYGYCLLGRVIEAVSGEPYEKYVQAHVLRPLGIRSMRLGRTRLDERQKNEVRYYDPGKGTSVFAADLNEPIAQPYGAWCLEAMDAHGGWLASAVDLARFASAFDTPAQCTILNEESIRRMYARPDGNDKTNPVYYACGWNHRVVGDGKLNHWHTGSLPGTSALLVRRHDGRNWVVLFNVRVSPYTSHLAGNIDSLVHRAADQVAEWPEYDRFEEYR